MRKLLLTVALLGGGAAGQVQDFSGLLEGIRARYSAPALAGVVVTGDQVSATALSGKVAGGGSAPTLASTFQLGGLSATMSATLIARLVERGLLSWDSQLGDVLNDVQMRPEYRSVTLKALLSNRSTMPFDLEKFETEPLGKARKAYLEQALAQPGGSQQAMVSNVARVAASMMAEKVTGKDWATLMRGDLFGPLGMTGCVVGLSGAGDPLPHRWNGDRVIEQPSTAVNPAVRNGADGVRCPLNGVAAFLKAHLLGEAGGAPFLTPQTWKTLHTDPLGGPVRVALEWGLGEAEWARGPLLVGGGNDTNNACLVWVIPGRNVAVMVATNIGQDQLGSMKRTNDMLNEAINALVREAFKAAP